MQTAKTLIRLGGCPGGSESSLGAQSLCWFCHVAAHLLLSWKLTFLGCSRACEACLPFVDDACFGVCLVCLGEGCGFALVLMFPSSGMVRACPLLWLFPCNIQELSERHNTTSEPRHDKTNKVIVCPVTTQISLGIRPVWSESSLCAKWVAFFMQTAKTLTRLGACPGWSESLLGTHSFCWFYHVAAHLVTHKNCLLWWLDPFWSEWQDQIKPTTNHNLVLFC